ncbi:MFS transporter [Streptomyces guryensis]|uniref:MFS transporter n=1 Tax=Streptomyces guryensis TaxID=2886947 RepID=A0A9Q3VMW0_9ACTN|nr:MFS transporter [Streptomyces guryensis]MCD9873921.1 MFS transporter [Streptomyces guryensis]
MRGLREVPRTVWLLACGTFVNMVVSVSFAYTFLYLTGPRGLGTGHAGLLSGVAGAGLVAGNFTGGWYGDRFGHRRVLLAGAAVSGLVLAAVPLLPTSLLFAALPLSQYAAGVQRAANSALVAVIVPEGARRQAFAVVRAAANGGFTLGPVLGALVATRFSYDWLYVAEGLGSLGLAGWTARVVPARGAAGRGRAGSAGHAGRGGVWSALRARPGVLVLLPAILVVDVVYRQQYSTFPVFLAGHGMDARVYGALLAINGGVLLCLELPVAVVLRRRSPLRIVGCGLLLVGGGYGVLLVGAGVGAAVVMMGLLTLGEVLYKTTATAYVADQAPEHVLGRFQSLYAGVSISGVVLAAPLGGVLYAVAPGVLWPVCALLGVVAGGAVLVAGGRAADRLPAAAAGSRPRRPYPSRSRGAAPSAPLGAAPPGPPSA